MKRIFYLFGAVACINLSACSLCLLECARPVDTRLKPYGVHWIKDGMTKESRKADSIACGAGKNYTVYVDFTDEQIRATKQPGDPNDINAYLRLRELWAQCMRSKGYVHIAYCDDRCLYP